MNETLKKNYRKLFSLMSDAYDSEPWNIFADTDMIELKLHGIDVYVTVLGNAGTCYGLAFYLGDIGLESYKSVHCQEISNDPSLFNMSCQNSYTIYWNRKEELSYEEADIIEEIGFQEAEGRWPSLVRYQTGVFPTNEVKASEVGMVYELLTTFLSCFAAYLESPIEIDLDEEVLVIYEHNDSYEVKKKPCDEFFRLKMPVFDACPIVPFYDNRKTYEIAVDAMKQFLEEDDKKYWCYLILLRDMDTGLIVSPLVVKADFVSPEQAVYDELVKYFGKNRAPGKIYSVGVTLTNILEQILEDAVIENVPMSEEMEEAFDLVNDGPEEDLPN